MHPIWYWVWLIAAFVFMALCATIFRALNERKAAREALERQQYMEAIESEIEAGHRLSDGRVACCVCRTQEATHRLPKIGLSMFERLNPLRDLYGSVRLYRRVDPLDGEAVVCSTHRDLYASFLDSELAEVRRLAAAFASSMDRRISDLRSGVLLDAVKQYASAKKSGTPFAVQEISVPLLTAHEEVAVSTQQTTNGKRREAQGEIISVEATN